ncbi:uncharacterized protein LOC117315573 [Pecten maximus]|uniref:uncharacterized protein LOC117315573 n=1 Tax=Pecten maximus TaxID=6579 RepID=UPI0014586F86|nr:uncharacterized protein LOC117315573 [Pecten maximus]
MATANIPVRLKGETTCIQHKGRQLELYCEKCHELVCLKCISSVHKGHIMCELSEITTQKKQDITNLIDRTEQNDLVQIRKYITCTDTLLKDNNSTFAKLSHEVKVQKAKLKQDLDKLTAETLSHYQKMKEDNAKLIQKYKQDLEMYDKQLKQQILECKTALQRGSDIEIYDTECEADSHMNFPVKPTLVTASIIRNKNPHGHLELAIGKVITSYQDHTPTDQDHSVSTSDDLRQTSRQQQWPGDKWKKAASRNILLAETKIAEEWQSSRNITSICPTTDDQAWTKYYKTLTLLDRKGTVIQKVKHKAVITDISLSPTTHRLWVCDSKNNILELVLGQLTHRFTTNEVPRCICVTASNHVIVGMPKHISKFTTHGQVVLTTMAAGTGKSLVCTPHRITECPVTHNVAVIDFSNESDGGDGSKRVVVMDTDFQHLFVYTGDIPSTSELFFLLGLVYNCVRKLIIGNRDMYTTYKQTGGKPFNPWGVTYDSVGNIVVGDRDNNRILLLSGDGRFLRIIHTDTYRTWVLGADMKDVVWAVLGDLANNVKLLQYNSM